MVVKARAREGDLDFAVGGVNDDDDDDDELLYKFSMENFLFQIGFW